MKIVSLVDNLTEKEGFLVEHGLSFYIETAEHKILFDVGANDAFIKNAEKLNIDLKNIDTVIISHGHYDHGGGLQAFLNLNDKAKIYIKKEAFGNYYSMRNNNAVYIGLNQSLNENTRFIFTDSYFKIDDELQLFSDIEISEERYSLNKTLKIKNGNAFFEDGFIHEQNLILKSNCKKILVAGCAHNGILNIIESFIDIEKSVPDCVIGGFHLSNPNRRIFESDIKIEQLAHKLDKWNTRYYTCHCTGHEPFKKLKSILKGKIEYFYTSNELNFN